jgi:hypothetical protein
MLALGTAIVSAVLTFMKPERAAEPRRRSPARHAASPRTPGPDLDLPLPGFEAVREAIDDIATKKAAIDDAAPGTQNRDYTAAHNKITKGTFDRDR